MALGKNYDGQDCSFAKTLEVLGERWTLLVIRDAMCGVRRFGDFQAHLDIPKAVLSQRLSALVEAGVLERRRYQDAPPRDEYVLTPMGRELWVPVLALAQWGERHLAANGHRRLYHHVTCGSLLEPYSICGTCGRSVPLEEVEVRPGPGLRDDARTDLVSLTLRSPHRMLAPIPDKMGETPEGRSHELGGNRVRGRAARAAR
ncbi:winged helix-turn-helix transcriptional regulator [Nonomuraea wenchangensis]|uniref:Transcriptional regulator, HxlR family n=1 Tax=Nonomuraea wenchangensis TaxID=568860 RepID=A0A1I0LMX7_9ACTN|nr:helix-turn-helix domain-containing protein [Nonomuraea wenchangensis]SEU41880.1 transcriptional regulator, HxlR family [Nonomuraea wenchangensis]